VGNAGGKSYDGWYLVSLIERFEWEVALGAPELAPVWENYHLVKAETVAEAYDKALGLREYRGKHLTAIDGRKGRWILLGISELLPIYEPLEDGSEIMFTKHGQMTRDDAAGMTRTKGQIESEYEPEDKANRER